MELKEYEKVEDHIDDLLNYDKNTLKKMYNCDELLEIALIGEKDGCQGIPKEDYVENFISTIEYNCNYYTLNKVYNSTHYNLQCFQMNKLIEEKDGRILQT
jgi:hypothetical protein